MQVIIDPNDLKNASAAVREWFTAVLFGAATVVTTADAPAEAPAKETKSSRAKEPKEPKPVPKAEEVVPPEITLDDVMKQAAAIAKEFGQDAVKEAMKKHDIPLGPIKNLPKEKYADFLAALATLQTEVDILS